ncbi:HNH endonuclease signature motif containing protein [Corynebacterium appendicis]|uniref:HNH endonuclease signature motif containing protein n=1 Tax=Corynebacterium appendicis TaxID=163202 RepID=UPI00254D273D|nr:HNH endonuclease signature motif containing protein [Corynebacterium appendicis]MDK8626411.1 HNH endonuclease signature motif containing protein [Corynebacterium appendicis]
MRTLKYDKDVILLVDRIRHLVQSLTKSKAELLQLIYDFDVNDFAKAFGASSTSCWLVREFGIAYSTAYEWLRVANQAVHFTFLMDAFRAAEIDYSTVRLLLKYLTADNEVELVELAKELGHEQMKKYLAGHGTTEPKEEQPEHYLHVKDLPDGDVAIEAVMSGTEGSFFKAALKIGAMAYYEQEHAKQQAAAEETRPARQTVSGYGMPIGRSLLQSFMGIINMVRTKATNTLRTPGVHVNIVLNADGHAYMPVAPKVPSAALANLVANGLSRLNVCDSSGLILNVGRAQRLATDAQVNALMTMWGHQCAMPGCTHTRFIEIHHMEEWADGGNTDLDNLIPLCSACHSLVTDGWALIERHGKQICFFMGDGSAYVSDNHSMTRRDDSLIPRPPVEDWANTDNFADSREPVNV